jgi:hypothetical protein
MTLREKISETIQKVNDFAKETEVARNSFASGVPREVVQRIFDDAKITGEDPIVKLTMEAEKNDI